MKPKPSVLYFESPMSIGALKLDGEIIVANKGSTDGSLEGAKIWEPWWGTLRKRAMATLCGERSKWPQRNGSLWPTPMTATLLGAWQMVEPLAPENHK
jgi:hypothetical protein